MGLPAWPPSSGGRSGTSLKAAQTIASLVAAYGLVSILAGGYCAVAVCSEHCDPCVEQCKCHTTCNQAITHDFGELHRLRIYRLEVEVDREGGFVRRFSGIVGLSLTFAYGTREHTADDFARFARGVLEVNRGLLSARGARWSGGAVEDFGASILVGFQRDEADDTLTFLFDRAGNLLEIEEVRSGGRGD